MPLFMDIHETVPEGVTLQDVIGAHEADVKVQAAHGVKYLKYWFPRRPARSSAWPKPQAPRPPRRSTGRPTAWWPT